MRLDINLATHPYEDVRQFWLRWGGALFLLSVFSLILLYTTVSGFLMARKERVLIDQARQQIAERDRERADAAALLNLPQNRSTRDRSQFLNQLFERKAFSWTRVFEDLERVMPARLHVVSIQPELTSDNQLHLKLVVAGESRDRALQLVRRMEESQRFHQTHIEQERISEGKQPDDNVQFDISAVYLSTLPHSGTPQGAP